MRSGDDIFSGLSAYEEYKLAMGIDDESKAHYSEDTPYDDEEDFDGYDDFDKDDDDDFDADDEDEYSDYDR